MEISRPAEDARLTAPDAGSVHRAAGSAASTPDAHRASEASAAIRASFLSLVPRMLVLHDQVAKDVGLTPSELQALHVVSLASGTISPGELSRRTGLPPSSVTRAVDGLERRGFVHRSTDPSDQRRVMITVDEKAAAPVGERFDAYARAMRQVDVEFDAAELAVVARHWAALSRAVDEELERQG
ncbi:MarR family winged helix-turn-helix transcriptional regulator [Humibacter ginsenosidimutans]|uniref:MarR family transcriptional regulator n=1 Tax=Humibacter ginsenosidimutans TaxID=2599293 RepID=A0A5B8M740_9MICO|nr:MarR family transcriptional regulator [Humibacter ginsenosidimutans]QDZ16206.1 MarR family transcriptional regulator [Humibacter ginsenosidimutans]